MLLLDGQASTHSPGILGRSDQVSLQLKARAVIGLLLQL